MVTIQDIERAVEENKDEAVEFLQRCIQTPSVTGDEAAMGEVMVDFLRSQGFDPKVYELEEGRPNVVAEWKGSKPGKRFVWNGHMDVFPPVKGDPGPYGPWAGKVVDGKIYGRGTADMKGGVCAAVMATSLLKRMGFDPAGSILMTWVSDEENTGNAGTKYLVSQGIISGDFGVDPEPTDGQVLVRHCGGLNVKVTYRSETGHTSIPHPSVTALEKTVNAAAALIELGRKVSYLDDETNAWSILSVTMMDSGNTVNMYPSEGHIIVDRRLVPGETIEEGHRQIKEALDALAANHPEADYGYEYEVLGEYPPLVVDESEPIVRLCLDAYREVTGKDTVTFSRGGASDASDVVEGAGVPMPNFGIAESYASTQPDESLAIEDYLTDIKVYMTLLVKALS
jgi:succinyl-diaminopimelate desuccinylase